MQERLMWDSREGMKEVARSEVHVPPVTLCVETLEERILVEPSARHCATMAHAESTLRRPLIEHCRQFWSAPA